MNVELNKRELQLEIFELTGEKVDLEDPIVIAALFYSQKLRQALDQNMLSLDAFILHSQNVMDRQIMQSIASLEAAAKMQQQELTRLHSAMIDQAKLATRVELPGIHREVSDFAKSMVRKYIAEVHPGYSGGSSRWKLMGGALVVAIAGAIVGAIGFGKTTPVSNDDAHKMAMGRAIMKVIPLLDKQTKEKLTVLLEKNE